MNNRQAAAALRELSPARIFARPTADDLWLGPTRESVLSQLTVPAATRVLVGPRSSGRSTLLQHLAHRNVKTGPTLRAPGPKAGAGEVLLELLRSAGLSTDGLTTAVEMRSLIDFYLEGQRSLGSRVFLELDDADKFDAPAWREIERIVEADSADSSPVLVLSLAKADENDSPAAMHVRSQHSLALGEVSWLDTPEVASYLEWRFSRFGLAGINTRMATSLIARFSQGSFAAIDHLCQLALLLLRQSDHDQLDIMVVRAASDQMRLRHRRRQQAHAESRTTRAFCASSDDSTVLRKSAAR